MLVMWLVVGSEWLFGCVGLWLVAVVAVLDAVVWLVVCEFVTCVAVGVVVVGVVCL